LGLKHIYKKLHNNQVVDIDLLEKVFRNGDVYMRDTVIAEPCGISTEEMMKVGEVVL
jgi:hypothetical protein